MPAETRQQTNTAGNSATGNNPSVPNPNTSSSSAPPRGKGVVSSKATKRPQKSRNQPQPSLYPLALAPSPSPSPSPQPQPQPLPYSSQPLAVQPSLSLLGLQSRGQMLNCQESCTLPGLVYRSCCRDSSHSDKLILMTEYVINLRLDLVNCNSVCKALNLRISLLFGFFGGV